jgi:hypothetical protein
MLLIPKIIILKSVFPFLAFLIAWEMVRKFFALYRAGQKKEIWRFICIFIFNTFGLLPIIYLLVDSTKEDIELWDKRDNIKEETKQTKKIEKGGVKTWKNAKSGKKQKEMQNVSSKENKVNTTKK